MKNPSPQIRILVVLLKLNEVHNIVHLDKQTNLHVFTSKIALEIRNKRKLVYKLPTEKS